MHDSLYRRRHGPDRHDSLSTNRYRCPHRQSFQSNRVAVGSCGHLSRRFDRHHLRVDGAHVEPAADHVGDGARRAFAQPIFRRGAPAFSHAVEVDNCDRHGGRSDVRAAASAHACGAGKHRHFARFCDRLRRRADHAPHGAGHAASLSLPAGPTRADTRHRVLLAVDVFAAGGELAAAHHLAATGLCDLFFLRPAAQRARAHADEY